MPHSTVNHAMNLVHYQAPSNAMKRREILFIVFSKYYAHASFFILSVGFIILPQAKIKIIWLEPNPRKFEAVVD